MTERFAKVGRQLDRFIAHPKTLDRARADVEGLGDLPHGEPLTSVTDEGPFEAARSFPESARDESTWTIAHVLYISQ
jgi:hypothetical protein